MKSLFDWKLPAAATSLALTVAACAALTPKLDHYTPPPLGSSYVQTEHYTGSYGSGNATNTIRRGERMWHGEKLVTYEGRRGTALTRPDGAWVAIVRGNRPILSWNPPANWEYPLEVGKTWTTKASVTIHAAKRTVPYTATVKVEAYEDVTTPAGTFKAFKVHQTDTFGNDNTDWLSPQLGIFIKRHLVRTAKSPRGPGTRDVEVVSQNIMK